MFILSIKLAKQQIEYGTVSDYFLTHATEFQDKRLVVTIEGRSNARNVERLLEKVTR